MDDVGVGQPQPLTCLVRIRIPGVRVQLRTPVYEIGLLLLVSCWEQRGPIRASFSVDEPPPAHPLVDWPTPVLGVDFEDDQLAETGVESSICLRRCLQLCSSQRVVDSPPHHTRVHRHFCRPIHRRELSPFSSPHTFHRQDGRISVRFSPADPASSPPPPQARDHGRPLSPPGHPTDKTRACRQELVQWLNSLLQLNITKVEQCGTG